MKKKRDPNKIGFFRKLGKKLSSLGEAFVKGDWATKLSFLISGFGFFVHKQKQIKTMKGPDGVPFKKEVTVVQWLRGLFYLLIETLTVVAFIYWGIPNFKKLSLQGLVNYKDSCHFNEEHVKVCEGYDNSFLILLFSIVTIVILVAFLVIHLHSINEVRKAELEVNEGRPIADWKKDLKDLIDNKFYISVLAIPVIGIVIFTIVPIIFMICIAFTNYDSAHMPPANFFDWVGWRNFSSIFDGTSPSFSTVFGNQLLWTLEWAVLATITCYIGGLLLALLLNSKKTRFRKVWRTCFVVTIAVPQFVTLMLIRFFLDKSGIINNWLNSTGFITWAHDVGFLSRNYDYLPFLEDPTWMKFTIIFVNMWVGFPYLMLIVSGILMNIPADLYESASIDGAGKTRMFFSITMPYILQVTGPYLISSFVSNTNNFNVIYLLTSGYTTTSSAYSSVAAKESDLLVTWLFSLVTGSSNRYYLASVIGIFMFIITSTITLLTFTQTTKGNREQKFQ